MKDPESILPTKSTVGANPQPNWPDLYNTAAYWQSSLKFYEDEVLFLNLLINKYFLRLNDMHHLDRIGALAGDMANLEKTRHSLAQRVDQHVAAVSRQINSPRSGPVQPLQQEQEALQQAIETFELNFRSIKHQIFTLSEQVIQSDRAKHLLGR